MGILSKMFSFVTQNKRKETLNQEISFPPADNNLVDKLRAEISDLKCQLQAKNIEADEALTKIQNDKELLNKNIIIYKKKIRNALMEQLDLIEEIEIL